MAVRKRRQFLESRKELTSLEGVFVTLATHSHLTDGKMKFRCTKGPSLDTCLELRSWSPDLNSLKYQTKRAPVAYLSTKIFLEMPVGIEKNLLGRLCSRLIRCTVLNSTENHGTILFQMVHRSAYFAGASPLLGHRDWQQCINCVILTYFFSDGRQCNYFDLSFLSYKYTSVLHSWRHLDCILHAVLILYLLTCFWTMLTMTHLIFYNLIICNFNLKRLLFLCSVCNYFADAHF